MTEQSDRSNDDLSWDAVKDQAPERPTFVSSLAEEPLLERPRILHIAAGLVGAAALAFLAITVLAILGLDDLRSTLLSAVPEDLSDEYSDDDIEASVTVLLAAFGVLGALLTLSQVLSVRSLVRRQHSGARVFYLVVTVLYVPVAFMGGLLLDADVLDLCLLGLSVLCLVAAGILMCVPAVTAWLRQRDQRRSIPLTDLRQSEA